MRRALDFELEAKAPDPEFNRLVPALFDKVILRLLRPFESDGLSLKLSLVHGDLLFADSRNGTGTIYHSSSMHAASTLYAHNE